MAIAVIVGILFATFLTLVVVPVMYSLADDFADLFRRSFVSRPESGADGGPGLEGSEGKGRRQPTSGPERDRPTEPTPPPVRPEPAIEPAFRRGASPPGDLATDPG